ncbi:hypothetical protein [Paraburkholderia sp.]|uniref:hypothetical protein n=1 Tax=Paraburkholderia sp. TaxID=1926495 RepID=UPI0025DFF41E|nr:hypothetical protein [Paraburkholderia sp.]
MSIDNATPEEWNAAAREARDEPIECSKTRKCGWKGMHSDLVSAPHKRFANAQQHVCPCCGCDSYYRREARK